MRNRKSRSKHGITLEEYRSHRILYRNDNPTSSKLTPELVKKIRDSTEPHIRWAERLGLSEGTIRAARDYTTWRHVK